MNVAEKTQSSNSCDRKEQFAKLALRGDSRQIEKRVEKDGVGKRTDLQSFLTALEGFISLVLWREYHDSVQTMRTDKVEENHRKIMKMERKNEKWSSDTE